MAGTRNLNLLATIAVGVLAVLIASTFVYGRRRRAFA
jgi:hypothetical protein